jgi:hypothetical protein
LPELLIARRIAALMRGTSSHPACFPDEVIEVYRQNALRPGGLTAMLNWYRFVPRRRVAPPGSE